MANITKSYAKIKNLVFKSITRALNSSVRFPGIWFITGCITRIAKVYYTKWCPPCPPEKKAMKWEELFGSQKLFKGSWIFFRFNGRGCPNGGVLWIHSSLEYYVFKTWTWSNSNLCFLYFFSIWVLFYEHSGLQLKGEGTSLTPRYHFHAVHRHLGISRAITAESSRLHISSSRTLTGNHRFPSTSRKPSFEDDDLLFEYDDFLT